jgi:hypothetical protein
MADGHCSREFAQCSETVLRRLEMPPGVSLSGPESDGGDRFLCGGGSSGKPTKMRRFLCVSSEMFFSWRPVIDAMKLVDVELA